MEKYIKVLQKFADAGVTVVILRNNRVSLNGFYKSDTAIIDFDTNTISTRYDIVERFSDEESLVDELFNLNRYWYEMTLDHANLIFEKEKSWDKAAALFNL